MLQDVPLHAFGRARRHWSLVLAVPLCHTSLRKMTRGSSVPLRDRWLPGPAQHQSRTEYTAPFLGGVQHRRGPSRAGRQLSFEVSLTASSSRGITAPRSCCVGDGGVSLC